MHTRVLARQLAGVRSLVRNASGGRGLATAARASSEFPALVISHDAVEARGSFAESQATFLEPDESAVSELQGAVERANLGVVAHYYMDAELQGALAALKWPHVFVADSLAMGDAAVRQVEGGATSVAVLGVDFMAESVRATLDVNGHADVPVYTLSPNKIGCSLAESAEATAYGAWLTNAAKTGDKALHVVYINTSLRCKAAAHSLVPTITCTSSNVVKTILTAAAQVPDLKILYGPDTYMGENLRSMFQRYAAMSADEVRALHPAHTPDTIKALLETFDVFPQGNCVVHHMFGGDVARQVRDDYGDAYITAHLEVPGEMFELAMEKQLEGRGAVGSTSDILGFIKAKAFAAGEEGEARIRVVLGTESGMVSSIVAGVQESLRNAKLGGQVQVEIIFPVAQEAVTQVDGEDSSLGLGIVPGVPAGEGCSTSGGCATCPYMKMNSIDALQSLAERIAVTADRHSDLVLASHAPRQLAKDVTMQGAAPILEMREFMRSGNLSEGLVRDIDERGSAVAVPKDSIAAWATYFD